MLVHACFHGFTLGRGAVSQKCNTAFSGGEG
jgi:hypothetical protein